MAQDKLRQTADQPTPTPAHAAAAETDDATTGSFIRKVDWSAFWTTFLITFGAYFYTMAPTVTLEDSGELAVASDYLGVPHPPGYPIWTLLTWFFQWVFHWVHYYGTPDSNLLILWKSIKEVFGGPEGYPNPAWSVGLCSAFFGALACAFLAMLVSRSGFDMLRSMKKTTEILGQRFENLISWGSGVIGGLLFAFSSVQWSQATIVEVYALNAFFFCLILFLVYWWMSRPQNDAILYITAFSLGLGLTNHQSLTFVGPAVLAAIWFKDRALFRDCIAGLCWLITVYLIWTARKIVPGSAPDALHKQQMLYTVSLLFLVAPVGLFLIERKLMTEWKRFVFVAFAGVVGLLFYMYLPVASDQNPPMNWGYPRTPEGFWHAFSRGQYEKIDPVANFKDAMGRPMYALRLLNAIITKPDDYISVVAQFTWPVALIAVFAFFLMAKSDVRARVWMWTTIIAFLSLTVLFVIFQYPQLDVQTLFIGRVQYIQAHAIFALWIAYGIVFILSWLDTVLGGNKAVVYGTLALGALLPATLVARNWYDEEFVKIVGGCEQNSHDFGWQFGAWELEGARQILKDLPGPEEANLPNPEYPPAMTTNAIFFGGTDPGRFVPTYMIYSGGVRSDVFLITQNALADNTYMNVMRDLYGDYIWIPSQMDSNAAFQEYVEGVRSGRIQAGADVSFEGGRVSVQGVQGVMTINGILCRMIFEANKGKHDFYVEESYVIPWMYPYLTPHGLILKLNREPLPNLTPDIVKNDHDFWNWYTKRLTDNYRFRRDVVARKTFSKLRSAIAGIYAFRRMYDEAEYAFKQAIDLYPLSPEANFRLADIYMQQFRFSDARAVIENFLTLDKENDKVREFLGQIKDMESADARRRELEGMLAQGGDVNSALELANIYRRMSLMQLFDGLTMNIINQSNLPPAIILQVAQMYADMRKFDMLVTALERYLAREPGNPQVWVNLAAAQIMLGKTNEAYKSLKRATDIGGEAVRDLVRKDQRFNPIRGTPEFNQLIPPMAAGAQLPMNFPLEGL
jgi:tetratricopeptide (TPR) repeat protein